jgi:glutamate-ammonia-ligase adenylyltransferase
VQYLQLLHGHDHPALRLPNTLEALAELYRLEIITTPEYEVLQPAYLFLRNVIDALRIVQGDASALVLPQDSSEDFKSLARRLGYREQDRMQAALRLSSDIRRFMRDVHAVFTARFL